MKSNHIGWIGLGKMGVPMVTNLLKTGIKVKGFDLNSEAGKELEAMPGFTRAETPVAAADGVEIVVLMLPDSTIVDTLLWDGESLAKSLSKGSMLIDMGSSNPRKSKANAERLAGMGLAFLDAPVSGGVRRAITATLAIIVGGTATALTEARPVLEAMGKSIVHVGDAGSGHAVKALNNYVSAAGLVAVSEALVAAERFGIDPHVVNQAFNASSGKNTTTEQKVEVAMLSGKYDSGFTLALMRKDIQTAADFIGEMSIKPAFVGKVLDVAAAADKALGDNADHTAIHAYISGLRA